MRWRVEPQGVASRLRGVQGKAVCDRPCGPPDTPRSRGGGATKTARWVDCPVRPPVMYHIHAAARCRQLDPRLCQERQDSFDRCAPRAQLGESWIREICASSFSGGRRPADGQPSAPPPTRHRRERGATPRDPEEGRGAPGKEDRRRERRTQMPISETISTKLDWIAQLAREKSCTRGRVAE